jgi:hypothetical protein
MSAGDYPLFRSENASLALGETVPDTRRKARQWRAFAN